jgi:hypothetical protein
MYQPQGIPWQHTKSFITEEGGPPTIHPFLFSQILIVAGKMRLLIDAYVVQNGSQEDRFNRVIQLIVIQIILSIAIQKGISCSLLA